MRRWLWLPLVCLTPLAGADQDLELFSLEAFETLDQAPPEPVLDGLWLLAAEDGPRRYLEFYARQRFVFRDDAGRLAAGPLRVTGSLLELDCQGVHRVFVHQLTADALTLTPAAGDNPRAAGDLATLPPHGTASLTWRRTATAARSTGRTPRDVRELAGEWTFEPLPGRRETLTLTAAGQFNWRGFGGVVVAGQAEVVEGQLSLSDARLARRFAADLKLTLDGWRLRLMPADPEPLRPLSDLADVSPAMRRQAVWERPLEPLDENLLTGRYEARDGPRHRLLFAPGGELRYVDQHNLITPLRYRLAGSTLTVELLDELGVVASRRFLIQPFLGGLLLCGWLDDAGTGPLSILPVGPAPARYDVR